MYPDPDKLAELSPATVLQAAAAGEIGLDHRFLRALLERQDEAIPAALDFSHRNLSESRVDIAPVLVDLFHLWKTPESLSFLIAALGESDEDLAAETMEAIVPFGAQAIDPLLARYAELPKADSGDVAFLLASLGVRDERILALLIDRLPVDQSDTLMLLDIYGDPAAIPAIEKLGSSEGQEAVESLRKPERASRTVSDEPFDIWEHYPETEDLPLEAFDEDERLDLLHHPVASIRAQVAQSFFNEELTPEQLEKLLERARNDESSAVRARAWEALINSTEQAAVIDAMLAALRNPELSSEERCGLVIGLAPEADRNEVRKAIVELYEQPASRAKALEAMWRSVHPGFRDYFARHLNDSELEVRRSAVWGVGYYGIRGELETLRKFLADEELRSDALFAYALATPAELSRGRMQSLLRRIEKDAKGLSEMEEELVKAALDERLLLAGKEPVFRDGED